MMEILATVLLLLLPLPSKCISSLPSPSDSSLLPRLYPTFIMTGGWPVLTLPCPRPLARGNCSEHQRVLPKTADRVPPSESPFRHLLSDLGGLENCRTSLCLSEGFETPVSCAGGRESKTYVVSSQYYNLKPCQTLVQDRHLPYVGGDGCGTSGKQIKLLTSVLTASTATSTVGDARRDCVGGQLKIPTFWMKKF